jgi:hypothetical protein
VSDHGRDVKQIDQLHHDKNDVHTDVELYYPLMMVKDFNSKGFKTSTEFMTNADVPAIAMGQVIENPVNPFTGNPINSDEKYAHDQFVLISRQWSSDVNNGNTFIADKWAAVHTDMRDPANWSFYTDSIVLKDHAFPQ